MTSIIKYWHYFYKEKIQLYDQDLRKVKSIDYKGTCPEFELWRVLGDEYNYIEQLTNLSVLTRNLDDSKALIKRLEEENRILRRDLHEKIKKYESFGSNQDTNSL